MLKQETRYHRTSTSPSVVKKNPHRPNHHDLTFRRKKLNPFLSSLLSHLLLVDGHGLLERLGGAVPGPLLAVALGGPQHHLLGLVRVAVLVEDQESPCEQ